MFDFGFVSCELKQYVLAFNKAIKISGTQQCVFPHWVVLSYDDDKGRDVRVSLWNYNFSVVLLGWNIVCT